MATISVPDSPNAARSLRDEQVAGLTLAGHGYWTFVGVLAALSLVGFVAWIYQVRNGLGVTGMNKPMFWGLYVVNFVFFVGLSAGGVIVASLVYAFDVKRFRTVARLAEMGAIACLVMAGIFITVDLGRPDRFYNLWLHPRWNSPLIWDLATMVLYLVVAMMFGYFSTRADLVTLSEEMPRRRRLYRFLALGRTDVSLGSRESDHRRLRVLAFVSLPLAVALHSITAWILGLMKGRPGWYTALQAPLFIVSAVVSGLALVIVFCFLAKKFLRAAITDDAVTDMGRLLALLIPIDAYFLVTELVTVARGPAAETDVWRDIVTGQYKWFFWTEVLVGLAIPFVLLVVKRWRTVPVVTVAAGLVVLGVFGKRVDIVLPALRRGLLPFAPGHYSPTFVEYAIVIGALSFGLLAFLALGKVFPLADLEAAAEADGDVTPPADVTADVTADPDADGESGETGR